MATLVPVLLASYSSASFARGKLRSTVHERGDLQVAAGMKEVRDRIATVKNTSKITEAMKLVAAAKVRRAQEAVINSRPFSENLIKVLYSLNKRLRLEDVESPLCSVRPVRCVLLVAITGDRGLCGGYNNFLLKQVERRHAELTRLGVDVKVVAVGRKVQQYMRRRPKFNVVREFTIGQVPSMRDAQGISDEILSSFMAEECDKVELLFTKFMSLLSSNPTTQTLLPLSSSGTLQSPLGTCVDAIDDEVFRLTSRGGKLAVERERVPSLTGAAEAALDPLVLFEQEPDQLLDALLPLYLNACLLRSLQEAFASELAARMAAMGSATDNAKELGKVLNITYNRRRQAKITQEIAEIVAGAGAGS